MEKLQNLNRHYLDIVIIFGLLIVSFIALSFVYESTTNAFFWHEDQAIHLSIAKNLAQGNGFAIDFAPWWGSKSTDNLINNYPEITTPQNNKGPIYYLALAGFFKLVSAEYHDYFYFGGIFNIFLTSAFLIIYFLFCRKYFSLTIATISGLTIATFPTFLWISSRTLPLVMEYLFIVTSFLFLKKNNLNYFLFGIFSGLAILTHPIGTMPLLSYLIILLFKQEFKGALIVFSISTLIVSPWFIRNILVFGNFGEGLGIPFASNISRFFGFETYIQSSHKHNPVDSISQEFKNIDFNYFLEKLFFNPVHQMDFLLILVIISISTILLIFIFSRYFLNNNLNLKYPKRLGSLSICYLILTLIGSFYLFVTDSIVISPRNILMSLFIILPFGIFGIYTIIDLFTKNKFNSKNTISFLIILSIIVLPVSFGLINGVDVINDYNISESIFHGSIENIQSMISEHIPSDAIVTSNLPAFLSANTGLTSIGVPYDIYDKGNLKKYFEHYNPEYFVVFGNKINSNLNFNLLKQDNLLYSSPNFNFDYFLLTNYESEEFSIFSIQNILTSDYSENLPINLLKAKRLYDLNKFEESSLIVKKIKDSSEHDVFETLFLKRELSELEKSAGRGHLIKNTHMYANLLFLATAQTAVPPKTLDHINKLDNDMKIEALNIFINTLEQFSFFHLHPDDAEFKINFLQELIVLEESAFKKKLNNSNLDDNELSDIFKELTDFQNKRKIFLENIQIRLNNHVSNDFDNNLSQFISYLDNSLNDTQNQHLSSELESNSMNNSLRIILSMIENDRFNPELWAQKGDINYNLKQWKQAIHSYEMALKFGIENEDVFLDKIQTIKDDYS